MRKPQRRLPNFAPICVASLALLAVQGCATRSPEVGSVVVAPSVSLPPVPSVVQQVQPKPPGYFQSRLNGYFSKTTPTPTN